MNATHPYNQILLAFWRQRERGVWGRLVLYSLVTIPVVAFMYFAPQFAPAILAGAATMFLTSIWTVEVNNLLTQNHPHAARFVPGHVRRLRLSALATWAVALVASSALLALFVPVMPSLAATLLFMAAALTFAAWGCRHWHLWLLISFGPGLFFGLGLDKRLAPLTHALQALWLAQPWLVLALCLLALGWSITRLFGDGDQAHTSNYASRVRLQRLSRDGFAGKGSDPATFGRPGEWLAQPFRRATTAWLQHALTRAQSTPVSVLQRAEIVLHGPQHWVRQATTTLVVVFVVAIVIVLGAMFAPVASPRDFLTGMGFGMTISMSSIGFNPGFALPTMLWHSRREQALLRLVPGMPQQAALNRAVAWLQIRHALTAWVITTMALTIFAVIAEDLALLCLPLSALPLSVGWLLRAPARMRVPSAWTSAVPIVAFMALGWGAYALNKKLDVPLLAIAVASVGISAAMAAWRWRSLVAAPAALPAGRLA